MVHAEQHTVPVARFVTLGSAVTALFRAPDKTAARLPDHWWECACGDDHNDHVTYPAAPGVWLSRRVARAEANEHAATCRSMPPVDEG